MSSKPRKRCIVAEELDEIHCNIFQGFPPVPEENRLTVEGAVVGPLGFLEPSAYADLVEHFGNEPPEELHPFPTTPGITAEEIDVVIGLQTWGDESNQGWMATNSRKPMKSNRFSLQDWGSWRLCFLLAWLQRAVWCHVATELTEEEPHPIQEKLQPRKRGRPCQVGTALIEEESHPIQESRQPRKRGRPALDQAPIPKLFQEVTLPRPRGRARHQDAEPDAKVVARAKHGQRASPSSESKQRGRSETFEIALGSSPRGRRRHRFKQREGSVEKGSTSEFECSFFESSECANEALEENVEGSSEHVPEDPIVDTSEPNADHSQEDHAIVIDFPPDPQDSRFTVEGALLSDNGKVKACAYKDEELMGIFSNEPPLAQHPDPNRPGLRHSELQSPDFHEIQSGLKSWNDKKGRGWIASRTHRNGKTESTWMSAVTLGSWRLALLLARLQVMVWRASEDAPDEIVPLARSPGKKRMTPDVQIVAHSSEKKLTPSPARSSQGKNKSLDVQMLSSRSPELKRGPKKSPHVQMVSSWSPDVKCSPGKRIPPDAKTKLLQERRKKKAGSKGESSVEDIDDVIDLAKIRLQVEHDLRILAEASSAELERIVGNTSKASSSAQCMSRLPRHRSKSPGKASRKARKSEQVLPTYVKPLPKSKPACPHNHSSATTPSLFSEAADSEHIETPATAANPSLQVHVDDSPVLDIVDGSEVTLPSKSFVWGRGMLKGSSQTAPQRSPLNTGSKQQVPERGPRTEEHIQAAIAELLYVNDIL